MIQKRTTKSKDKVMEQPKHSLASSKQKDRFVEAARQLGADEDEAAFKAKLAQIARQKPKGDVPEPPKDGE